LGKGKKRKSKKAKLIQKTVKPKIIKNVDINKLNPKLREEIKKIEQDLQKQQANRERTFKDMRILWFSVAPYVKSGYGVVTKNFVSRFIDRGFTSMVVAYYGLAKNGFLKVGDIVTFPIAAEPGDNLGFKSAIMHHKKFNTDCIIFHCYDEKTEILTKDGWKFFKDLKEKEKVATLNRKGELEYQRIRRLFEDDYKGKMYSLKTSKLDLCVTPNHRMWVRKRNKENFEAIAAEEVFGKRVEYKKDCIWHGREQEKWIFKDLTLPMDYFLEFLGWWLSEGSVSKRHGQIRIYQQNKKKRKLIEKTLRRLDFKFEKDSKGFFLYNRNLAEFLRKEALENGEKKIPRQILKLSSRQLRKIYRTLMLGDGHVRRNGTERFYSSDKTLLDGMQELCLKIGKAADIVPIWNSKNRYFGKYKCKEAFVLRILRTYKTPTVRSKEFPKSQTERWIDYEGKVRCVSVPNSKIYVRRNGKAVWCMNTDFWVARPLTKACKEVVAYTVLDHEDYAEEYQDVLRSFFKVSIASKFGCKEAKKYGIDATFIPHGVDLGTYKPLPKEACKRALTVDPDTFTVGIVAANNDKEPRKGWDKMFAAIREFLDNNPEMRDQKKFRVFCHTDARNRRGYDLKLLKKRTGIGKFIIFQDPYMSIIGLPDPLMVRIYNAFDVLMNLSRREGFCLPILEAQACGVPCIATDFSAMTERLNYGKCGWLVKPATTMLSPLGGVTAIPDEHKAAEALEEACFNKKKRDYYSKKSLQYARTQTWDIAVDKYWMPFLEELWSDLKRPAQAKKPKVLFQSKKAKEE